MTVKHGISSLLCLMATASMANPATAQGILGGSSGGGASGAVQGALNSSANGAVRGAANAALNGSTSNQILQQGVRGAVSGNTALSGNTVVGDQGIGLGASGRLNANGSLTSGFADQLRSQFTTSTRILGDGPVEFSDRLPQELRKLGFQPGDVLLDAKGEPLRSLGDVRSWVTANGKFNVLRDGENTALNLGGSANAAANVAQAIGLSTKSSTEGLVVTSVSNDSVAAQAGLKTGDQIIQVNGKAVQDRASLTTELSASGDNANIVYLRGETRNQAQIDITAASGAAATSKASNGAAANVSTSGSAAVSSQTNVAGTSAASGQNNADLLRRLEAVERAIEEIRVAVEKR